MHQSVRKCCWLIGRMSFVIYVSSKVIEVDDGWIRSRLAQLVFGLLPEQSTEGRRADPFRGGE